MNKMNVKPEGKQQIMRGMTWNIQVCKLYYKETDGRKVAKGLKMILESRGISMVGKIAEWMGNTLAQHSDFQDKKSMVERMLVEYPAFPSKISSGAQSN